MNLCRSTFAFAFLLALAPRLAFAQAAEDKAQARDLANAGFDALDNHDWAKAEDSFQRADALFHAPTMSVGLARAQAHLGKVVEAWENYHRVIIDGAPAGANETQLKAIEDAKTEIAAVEARRGKVTITVTGSDRPNVTVDGVTVSVAALGAARPSNPGTHQLHAAAEGYAPVDTTFTVEEGKELTVPVNLERVTAPPPPPEVPAQGNGKSHTLSFIGFGVGAAGLVTGAITGILAVGKHNDLKSSPCASGRCEGSLATSFNSELGSYHSLATVSTIGFIVGGVGAAAGGVLLFTGSGGSPKTGSGEITPYVGFGNVGAVGRF